MPSTHNRNNSHQPFNANPRKNARKSSGKRRLSMFLAIITLAIAAVGVYLVQAANQTWSGGSTIAKFFAPSNSTWPKVTNASLARPKRSLAPTAVNSITAIGAPFTENFDGIGSSTTATLPTGWRTDSITGTPTTNFASAATATTQAA